MHLSRTSDRRRMARYLRLQRHFHLRGPGTGRRKSRLRSSGLRRSGHRRRSASIERLHLTGAIRHRGQTQRCRQYLRSPAAADQQRRQPSPHGAVGTPVRGIIGNGLDGLRGAGRHKPISGAHLPCPVGRRDVIFPCARRQPLPEEPVSGHRHFHDLTCMRPVLPLTLANPNRYIL